MSDGPQTLAELLLRIRHARRPEAEDFTVDSLKRVLGPRWIDALGGLYTRASRLSDEHRREFLDDTFDVVIPAHNNELWGWSAPRSEPRLSWIYGGILSDAVREPRKYREESTFGPSFSRDYETDIEYLIVRYQKPLGFPNFLRQAPSGSELIATVKLGEILKKLDPDGLSTLLSDNVTFSSDRVRETLAGKTRVGLHWRGKLERIFRQAPSERPWYSLAMVPIDAEADAYCLIAEHPMHLTCLLVPTWNEHGKLGRLRAVTDVDEVHSADVLWMID